jgi:hypothetical protein
MRRLNTFTIERLLAQIARDQFGLITCKQAAEQGIDHDRLDERARQKTLVRLFRGVYRSASAPGSKEQSILAAWLAVSKTSVAIARVSAAQIHGLPIGKQAQTTVDLVCFGDERVRNKGIRMTRTSTNPQTQGWRGARLTTVSQTICDLASELDRETLARCVDHAIANRSATVASIRRIALSQSKARFKGRATLLSVLNDRPNGNLKHRSMFEHRVGKWLVAAGLGDFIPNFVITEAGDIEVDFAWLHSYVCLEVSPFFTHGSEHKQQRDIERRQLLAPTRWTLVEVTDADLQSPAAFERIVQLLKQLIVHSNISDSPRVAS